MAIFQNNNNNNNNNNNIAECRIFDTTHYSLKTRSILIFVVAYDIIRRRTRLLTDTVIGDNRRSRDQVKLPVCVHTSAKYNACSVTAF